MARFPAWLFSGILLGLSFPSFENVPTSILAWFALVPFLLDNRKKKTFWKFTLESFFLLLIYFFLDTWWVGYYSIPYMLIGILGIAPFFLIPFMFYHLIKEKWNWSIAGYTFPFLWTINDWFMHLLPHSMQVYLLPYSQSNTIWLIQFVDIFGMWGISFWLILFNVLVANAIDKRKTTAFWKPSLWLLAPLAYSFWCFIINPKSITGLGNLKSKVSVIQTNQDSYATQNSASTQSLLDEIFCLSDSAVARDQPDLLVLPEATIPFALLQDQNILNFTKQAISAWQTSVAIGFVEHSDSLNPHYYKNNALVFTPQLVSFWDTLNIQPQDVKVYQKEHGLPFVELTPYFEEMSTTARGQVMLRGKEPYTFKYQNFDNDQFEVALSICWEQLFPKNLAQLTDNGAQFLVLMNNDAWFGKTPGSRQLQSFTRMRAIENRRSIVRSSNGGISCFIDPFGRVYGKLPWFTPTFGTQEVEIVSKKSFFTSHPEWFPKFCFVFLIGFLVIVSFQSKNASPKKLQEQD